MIDLDELRDILDRFESRFYVGPDAWGTPVLWTRSSPGNSRIVRALDDRFPGDQLFMWAAANLRAAAREIGTCREREGME